MNKALLVGINYPGQSHFLRGCVNDVLLMNQIIKEKFGFGDPLQTRVIIDNAATTAKILEGLEWLVRDARPGDVLFFHYSGHGSQMITVDFESGVEPDGLDEIICPVDLDWRDRVVRDNDFERIFSKLPEGVNLTVILDCCHSGGGLRPFMPPEMKSPNRVRAIDMPADIAARGYGLSLPAKPLGLEIDSALKGVLFSGCHSHETSADAWIQSARKYHGALTWYLFKTLEDNNWNVDHGTLVHTVNRIIDREGYSQHPELNCRPEYVTRGFLKPYV